MTETATALPGQSAAIGRLSEFFDLVPSFLAVLQGPDHVYERVNPAYLQLVGNRPLIGLRVRDALPEVVDQGFLNILDNVYESGEPYVASELPVRLNRDGVEEERIVSFVYHPLRREDGCIDGIAAHGIDVTEQVRTRETIREREALYRSLIENSQDKIAVLRLDGTILYESPASERLLGWSADEMIGRNVLEVIHPDDHEQVQAHLGNALRKQRRPRAVEHRLLHRDGSWRLFETVGQARLTDSGMEIVTNSRDITARKAADAALHESRERFRIIQDASPNGFLLFRSVRGADGCIVDFECEYVNPAASRLLGRDGADLPGKLLLAELPGSAPTDLCTACCDVVESGNAWSSDFTYRIEEIDRTFHADAVRVGDGFGFTLSEITAQHRAAAELREREERFRALVEQIPQLVWATTPDGYHDYFNQRWYEYTGMPRTGHQGWNWKDYLHPDDYERAVEVWQRSLATGESYEIEYRFKRGSDGSYRWFIGRALPLFDEHGTIIRWFGTCTDVHDERIAREASEESERRYRTLMRATNDVIWDWDFATDRVERNEHMLNVFRFEPGQMPDSNDAWRERVHTDDRARVIASCRAAIDDGGDVWSDEYRFVCGDGDMAYVLDRAMIIRDDAGRAIRMIGSMIDLTERNRLHEELRQSQKMEAIGRLAGGIAHDFNNMLTVITNYSDLLLEELAAESGLRDDVDGIRKAADRAASLTRQLLAFSRRQMLQPRSLDLNDIVTDMTTMLRRLIGADIALDARTGTRIQAVHADPGQMEQVLLDLAVNARDAMPDGGTLTVETSNEWATINDARRSGHAPGQYVALVVRDTGLGIDAVTRARMFEPFFTTKSAGQGTGLGLATVHGIVTQSGGFIEVESEPGNGSTFRILLPAHGTAADPHKPAAGEAARPHGDRTVLLVEDEEGVRGITRRALSRNGYRVIEAGDGREALTIMQAGHESIDLILTDLVMPRMGGRELSQLVAEFSPATPVLFMSGYAEADMQPLNAEGRFLEKPFTLDQLLKAVAAV